MKIRNLLVMAITMALGTLCVAAQAATGSVTFTDHLQQSITISRYGTVLKFKDGKGRETTPNHAFRICPRVGNQCIESANTCAADGQAELYVESPREGTTLKAGETLIITATIARTEATVTRKVMWVAGSGSVTIDEIIAAADRLNIETIAESGAGALMLRPCPPPAYCPPKVWLIRTRPGRIESDTKKPLKISSAIPLMVSFTYTFPKPH